MKSIAHFYVATGTPKRVIRTARFFVVVSILLLVHHFFVRPWFLDWGAPEKIQKLVLSGDQFTGGGHHSRAVLVQASADKIWPWITQLGQERGGFYSYTFLENLVHANMRNIYELRPELQELRLVGDTIWLADKRQYDGGGYQISVQVIPNQSFVMVGGEDFDRIMHSQEANGSWSIYLYQENPETTWLIARSSTNPSLPQGDRFLRYLTFEVPHFIMEQKMLRTIKRLAEK